MKRKTVILMAVLALVLVIPAYAVSARAVRVLPSLVFDGTTATCTVKITGNSTSDKITATIELTQGGKIVESWTESGTGTLKFEDTVEVSKGKTYTLSVDATVNGRNLPTASTSKTCK